MRDYRIFETKTFQRDLERLGPAAARRIRVTLQGRVYPVLKANPRAVPSVARLRNWEPPTWRIRVENWKAFLAIDDGKRIVFLLDLDGDELQAAKEIVANRGTTAERVLSELARKGVAPRQAVRERNGVPLIPRRPKGTPRPTLEKVNRLRDEL